MSLLLLLGAGGGSCPTAGTSTEAPEESGLFQAILDAIHGVDNAIAGQALTRLTQPLVAGHTVAADVESTLGFGVTTDGTTRSRLLVGGEVLEAETRVDGPGNFAFCDLTRGLDGTEDQLHNAGTLVYDLSQNASALDHARRGFFVDTAVGDDLDTIGRNLGLEKCLGLSDDTWRAVIKAVAYLPKQPQRAFDVALEALLGAGNYTISENIQFPYTVFVKVANTAANTLKGRFVLQGGEVDDTATTTTIDTDQGTVDSPLSDTFTELGRLPGDPAPGSPAPLVIEGRQFSYPASATGTAPCACYLDSELVRRGYIDGQTNYFLPSPPGAITDGGTVITMGTSPGAAGTVMNLYYTAQSAHYLAQDETQREDADFYAYLADPLLATRCLLEQIRAAGVKVDVMLDL